MTSPIDSIPMPVERCLRFALGNVPGRTIGEVRLAQVGSLRTELHTERWLSFEATHHVRPGQVAFEWIARVRIAPLVHLRVRDALENGTGSSDLKLWSVLPVARAGPSPEMNAGSLHRFLAEAAWYPSVLRPSERLHWNAIDDTRARATLDAHGTSVELEFRFGPRGEITGIFTPARWGRFDGRFRQVAWEGRFADYEEFEGVVVPRSGEVGWFDGGHWTSTWRGRIVSAHYRFA